MITSLSFCILAVNKTQEALDRCLASIRRQGVPDFEILIGGVNKVTGSGIVYLYRAEWPAADPSPTNEMRNEFCKRATKDFLVLIDADIELAPDWYENIKAADCFDLVGSRLTNGNKRRIIDWAYLYPLGKRILPLPLAYNEWTPKAYVNGALMLLRRSIWDSVEFDEDLGLGQNDDAEFCQRVSEQGYRLGVFPAAQAICREEKSALSCGHTNFEESLSQAQDFRELNFKAWMAYERKNFYEAIKLYEKVVQMDPDRPQSWGKLGWSHYFINAYPAAIRAFDAAINLDPKNQEALRGRGWAYHQIRRDESAIQDFSAAMENLGALGKKGLMQETLRGRAWAHYRARLWSQALNDFTEALNYTETSDKHIMRNILRGRAWSLYKTRDFNESVNVFEKMLQYVDPNDKAMIRDARKGIRSARAALDNGGAALEEMDRLSDNDAMVWVRSSLGYRLIRGVKRRLKGLLLGSGT